MKRLSTVWFALALLACGDDDKGGDDVVNEAGRPDAAVQDAGLDAATDARAPGDDASTPGDASSDATAPTEPDATTPDTGVPDAGAPSLRASICGDQTNWPDPLPPMPMRNARRERGGFNFTEGPVWVDELDELFFSDMNMGGPNTMGPPSRMHRFKPPAAYDVLVQSAGSNGIALFAPTTLLAATHDTRSLSFFDARTGARTNIDIKYDGKLFDSPNDLVVRDDGWVYFSDPWWQRANRPSELDNAIYRVQLTTATTTATAILIDKYDRPNGMALSPDQRTLYVGSVADQIVKYDVAVDGSVSNRTDFVKPGGGADGFGVDCAGNLYVTSGGSIHAYAPNGTKLGQIAVSETPTNVAFGGPEHKTLYITTQGGSLFAIDLNVPGFPY